MTNENEKTESKTNDWGDKKMESNNDWDINQEQEESKHVKFRDTISERSYQVSTSETAGEWGENEEKKETASTGTDWGDDWGASGTSETTTKETESNENEWYQEEDKNKSTEDWEGQGTKNEVKDTGGNSGWGDDGW